MAKTISHFLNKYHKQNLFKKPFLKSVQAKETLVNQYGKVYEVTSERDALLLDVYYVSTLSKEAIQNAIDDTRNQVFDMWDHLTNLQKNHLIQVENEALYASLPHFYFNNQKIYISFFNELLNSLIDNRPDVFELDQFFKLYRDYQHELIDIRIYGHHPFKHGFSECELIGYDDQKLYLYHPILKVLYELVKYELQRRFPFSLESNVEIDALKDFVSYVQANQVDAIKEWLISHDVLSPKAKKASMKKSFNKIVEV